MSLDRQRCYVGIGGRGFGFGVGNTGRVGHARGESDPITDAGGVADSGALTNRDGDGYAEPHSDSDQLVARSDAAAVHLARNRTGQHGRPH